MQILLEPVSSPASSTPFQFQIFWHLIGKHQIKPKEIASQLNISISEVRTKIRKQQETGII